MALDSRDLIFLVDDDPYVLATLEHFFKKKKFQRIVTFKDGESCVQQLGLNPRLIVLDYYLSAQPNELNGLEVFLSIQQHPEPAQVVMMSGQDDAALVSTMVRNGLRHYVIKDIAMLQSLEETLEEI